jgi:hypothetical protein
MHLHFPGASGTVITRLITVWSLSATVARIIDFGEQSRARPEAFRIANCPSRVDRFQGRARILPFESVKARSAA